MNPENIIVCSVTQWYPTLYNPMDCIAFQAPLSMGFSRQERILEWAAISSRDHSNPGIEPTSYISCISKQVLYHWRHLGSPVERLNCG